MEPKYFHFMKPDRDEWRLADIQDPKTGDMLPVRHSDNGPAVITVKGYKAWYNQGVRHRLGAPAVEYGKFTAWFENGKLHRVQGPAITFSDGTMQWWENGVRIK
jgi:hypothetical protein